jgi:hypothetical protein
MKKIFKSSILFSLLTLFTINSIYAQGGRKTLESQMFINKGINSNSDVKGSPYLSDKFTSAIISPLNKTYSVRYNAFNDEMEVKDSNGEILIMNKTTQDYIIKMTATNQVFKILKSPLNEKLGYYSVVSENQNISLYKKLGKKIKKGKAGSYASLEKSPDQFVKTKTVYYFLQKDSKTLQKFPTNKKELLTLFDSNKDDLKNFIKKNKIKFNKDEGLNELIIYLIKLLG